MDTKKRLMRFLEENVFITLSEARQMGITPMGLSRLISKEKLYRTERGVYALKLDWLTHPLKKYLPICTKIPDAVICGVSALSYYDLTDEEERQIWLAIPFQKKLRNPHYRAIRVRSFSYSLGITSHTFGKRTVHIYDIEKTVVDAFKYLSEELALKALRGYMRRKNKDIHKLCTYGKKLKKPLDPIVKALLIEE